MAGEKTVAPTNGMQNILGLLQTIAGTETKTTSTANIGPLQSVMDQIAASQGTQGQQLLESIFAQAAGAVPGIMGNTFNASGSRAPSNVMAGTLQKLMADVTKQAQAQIVQQQQNAQQMQLNAATQIANATRGQRQVQKSGASDIITKGGKLLATNKLIKDLTGKDLVQSGVNGIKSLFTASPTAGFAASGYNGLSTEPGMPLFGGTSTSNPGFSDVLSTLFGGSSPMSGETTELPVLGAAAETSPLFVSSRQGSDLPADLSAFTSLASTPGGVDGLSVSFGDSAGMEAGTNAFTSSAGFQPSTPEGFTSDFSSGGDSGSAANDAATFLKVYGYAKDPDKRKDIFDFSDGNFADDVGDITDAVALYFPPAAAVRPFLNTTMATGESIDNFVHNPGQWLEDLFSGDEPITKTAYDTVVGTVKGVYETVSDLGQDVIDFGGNVLEEVGDVFGGDSFDIGNLFDW